jgi:hypothetical protein
VCASFSFYFWVLRQQQQVVNSFTQILKVQNTNFFPSVEMLNNTNKVSKYCNCMYIIVRQNEYCEYWNKVFTVYISVNE